MLKRNLLDLKTDKGDHFADILTNLYRKQMRLICEEQKAYEQRTVELKAEKSQAPAERVAGSTSDERKVENQSRSELVTRDQRVGASSNAGNGHIDKSHLPISTPRRMRDKIHLRYVASQPCLICGRTPSHAHHLRFAQPKAFGRKVSDEWTVPLCSTHHRALHSVGDEKQWWTEKGIDPTAHALRLWWDTRHGGIRHPKRVEKPRPCAVLAGSDETPQAAK
jgi:hypothetical protein